MKKVILISLGILFATSIANCIVPVNGTTTTVVAVDELATVTAVTSTTTSSSGISGDGSVVAPSVYNDGVNDYYIEQPPDSGPMKDDSWKTLPFWFYYIQWLIFL
jgi:hypothetical protein